MKNLIRLSAILLFACSAEAQDLQRAQTKYWTRSNIVLISADAIAKSADMAFTMRNSGLPHFQEHDALARPLVHSGPALAGATEGLLFATEVFTAYELHKHGHGKMANVVPLLGTGGNAIGVATSSR